MPSRAATVSEAGCTLQQIATIIGHSLKAVHRILERYLARTGGLAEQTILAHDASQRKQGRSPVD
jgi:hypothetical protein